MTGRVNTPVSTAELERRWRAVRAAMEAEAIDVLVAQSSSESLGGYVRWLTDVPPTLYPTTVVFPREDAMTVVTHGPLGAVVDLPPEGDGVWRGVRRVVHTASFLPAAYTREDDALLAANALAPYARGAIGLLGTAQMSHAFGRALERALPAASLSDVSELVDAIKAVKSAEEIELLRAAARMQDAVMQAAFEAVEPGRRESDVTAAARLAAQERGSEAGILLSGSGPFGEAVPIGPRHLQDRVLRPGDLFQLLIEVDGPGGMYTEIGRTFSLGPPPQAVVEELEFTLAAQRFTLGLLVPGASPPDIWDAYNAFMREHGRPEERRLHCHAQGYDLVERPLIRFDETLPVAAGTTYACHPTYACDGFMSWICDDHLVLPGGGTEPLHTFPAAILER